MLILGLGWLSWLAMMAVHELGHVVAAIGTGGQVDRVVWHPMMFSRTDVQPNPRPLAVAWSGPIVGCMAPIIVAAIMTVVCRRVVYLFVFFAGFCLIANGAYIGLGVLGGVGDAGEMLRHGSPRWLLVAFGIVACLLGLWRWHRVGARFGFGRQPLPIDARHVWWVMGLAAAVTLIGFMLGATGD